MKTKSITLIFLLGVAFLSCSKEERPTNTVLTANIVEELTVSVPDTVLCSYEKFAILENEESFLLLQVSTEFNVLDLFDLNQGAYLKTIPLPDPRSGFGRVKEVAFHNVDSIFLYNSASKRVALIDTTGQLHNLWNFDTLSHPQVSELSQLVTLDDAFSYNPVGKEFSFRTVAPYDFYIDPQFYKVPYRLTYSLNDSSISTFYGIWPEALQSEDTYFPNDHMMFYAVDWQADRHFVSFKRVHEIFEINRHSNTLVRKGHAKSDYLNRFEVKPRDHDFSDLPKRLISHGRYDGLLHDKYRKQVYHFARHNTDFLDEEGNFTSPRKVGRSIVVLDDQLNTIGEWNMPIGDYAIFNHAVVKDGLLLFKYHECEEAKEFKLSIINFNAP